MTINLTKKQCEDIAYDQSKEFSAFNEEIINTGRWHNTVLVYFIENLTQKIYCFKYKSALTENQEDEFENQDCDEFEEYEETVITKKYRKK